MTAESAPAPKAAPPKLNPVRVSIAEETVAQRTTRLPRGPPLLLEGGRDPGGEALHPVPPAVVRRGMSDHPGLPRLHPSRSPKGDFDEAARVTLRENPLATSLCKVCYHYCEDACVVKKKGVPIAIRHLKRASLEFGQSDLVYVPSKPKHQRVAVVGAARPG